MRKIREEVRKRGRDGGRVGRGKKRRRKTAEEREQKCREGMGRKEK